MFSCERKKYQEVNEVREGEFGFIGIWSLHATLHLATLLIFLLLHDGLCGDHASFAFLSKSPREVWHSCGNYGPILMPLLVHAIASV